MGKATSSANIDILRYALTHLEQERDALQGKIDHINRQLGVAGPSSVAVSEVPVRKTRILSASARKRIAAAQKKRWDEHRRAKAAAA